MESRIPLSVVLIEDDRELIKLLAEAMSEVGFKVVTAIKVTDATIKLRNQRFDCIVLDLRLEQGNGEDVVTFVRNDRSKQNVDTPIILTSGYVNQDVISRIGNRISAALVKPFDPAVLIAAIKKVCDKK
jgi:DNA-binding response OmpR family regulator